MNVSEVVTCELAGEVFTIEIQRYPPVFMSILKEGVSQPTLTDQSTLAGIPNPFQQTDNRLNYEDVDPQTCITCATHAYGVKDQDSAEMWEEIIVYLKADILPARCQDPAQRKSFIR